jgi:hypothetical protein
LNKNHDYPNKASGFIEHEIHEFARQAIIKEEKDEES